MTKEAGYTIYQKATSFFSLFSLFLQITLPLTYAFPARAQEVIVEPTLVPTPEPTTVEQQPTLAPEPTLEATVAPTQEPTVEPTAVPTVQVSPTIAVEASPTAEISPTIAQEASPSPEITITPAITETPAVIESPTVTTEPTTQPTSSENSSPAPTSEIQSTPTATETPAMSMVTPTIEPIVTVAPVDGHVDTTVVESYSCRSDSLNGCLISDKADYAPTDVALITGYGFLPNTQYTLKITSFDQPEVNFQSLITSNEQGSFSYSYQLDGNYRPNYSVNLTDLSGVTIASTSFTDSRTINSATVNGSSSITVVSGATITAAVNATTTNSDNWESTSWLISNSAPGTMTCANTGNHSSSGTYTETFNITAPVTPGTYNAYFRIHNGDTCSSSGQSSYITLTNAITVVAAPSWPTSWNTPGSCVADPSGESGVSPSEIDLTGNAATPAVGFNTDSSYAYFRERVIGNPGTNSNLNNYSWVALFQTSIPQYQYLLALSGKSGNKVILYDNTTHSPDSSGVDFSPLFNDPADNSIWEGSSNIYARVTGSGPYYLDWAIPISELTSRGINTSTTKFFATSTNANNYNKDYLKCYESFADLSIVKSDSPDPVTTGNTLTYTLAIHNAGPDTATGVVVTDTLPTGYSVTSVTPSQGSCSDITAPSIQCELGTMANNANATVTIVGTATGTGTLTNSASVTLDTTANIDRDLSNNTDTEDTTINQLPKGHLIVQKTTIPANDSTQFSITASGSGTITGNATSTVSDSTDKDYEVTPGTYSVTETVPTGWTKTGDTCQNISVASGETKYCLITNTKQSTITITKILIPANDTGKFNLLISGTNYKANAGNGGTTGAVTLTPGTYTVSESAGTGTDLSQYVATYSGDCAIPAHETQYKITLATGENKTCTITNTKKSKIIVKKVTSPVGSSQSFHFSANYNTVPGFDLKDGQSNDSGYILDSSQYWNVTEDASTGWTTTSSCDNGNQTNSIKPNPGQTVTCTFTNTRDTGTLRVYKNVDLNGDGDYTDSNETNNSTWKWQYNGSADQTTGASAITLPTGNYVLTETAKTDYHFENLTCTGGVLTSNSVALTKGANVVCTFYNTRNTGSIKIIKDSQPDDTQNFVFTVKNQNNQTVGTTELDDDNVPNSRPNNHTFNLITGTYKVSENSVSGWHLQDIDCDTNGQWSFSNGSLTVDILSGNTAVCKFTNIRETGTIELKKVWSGTPSIVTLKIGTQENGSQIDSQQTGENGDSPLTTGQNVVNTGTYYLSETNLNNYDSDLSCFNDSDNDGHQDRHENKVQVDSHHHSVSVDTNEHILCTFTNTRDTGSIKVHKQVDNDGNGTFETTSDSSANNLGFRWGLDSTPTNNTKNFGNSVTVDTGTTSVYENAVTGYHFVGWFSSSNDHDDDHHDEHKDKEDDKIKYSCTKPEGTTLPVSVSISKNKTTEITLCNAKDMGHLTVYKYQDYNANGIKDEQDSLLDNWDILAAPTTGSTITKTTDESGKAEFDLVAGNYNLNETLKPDWYQSTITCDNQEESRISQEESSSGKQITISPGQNMTCYIGNYQKSTITIQKDVVDFLGNEISDNSTFTVSGGESLGEKSFSEESSASFLVNPGTYTFSETNLDNKYKLKNINNCDGQILETGNITAESGRKYCLTFTNQKVKPVLNISKTNNRWPNNVSTGSDVQYTLSLTVTDNDINDVVVVDLPPFGIKYKSGSFSATKNGANFAIVEPIYSSPGKWYLGNLNIGDTVVLNYLATVDSYAAPGIYKDLAYAYGCSESTSNCTIANSDKVLASADVGKLADTYVGTQVGIIANASNKDINVLREEKNSGAVLGATTSLPATGSNNLWLILSFALSLLGLSLLFIRKKMLNIVVVLVLALTFVTPAKTFATPSDVFIRLYEPKSPSILSQFPLDFTLMDQQQNRVLTVQCFVVRPDNSELKLGNDISIKAGGNSGQCDMGNFSLSEDNKTYKFIAKVLEGSTPLVNSQEVSVLYDGSKPETPSYFGKEKITDCQYKIKFKAANDGQTVQIKIYRADTTSFIADSGSLVGEVGISPNTEGSFISNIPENCNKEYYYAIRAFDANGNASDVVGDTKNITVTSSTSSSGTSVLGSQTGAIPVQGVNLGGEKNAVNNIEEAIDTKNTTLSSETSGTVLGQQTVVQKVTNTLGKLLIPALFAIGILLLGYGFKKRKEEN